MPNSAAKCTIIWAHICQFGVAMGRPWAALILCRGRRLRRRSAAGRFDVGRSSIQASLSRGGLSAAAFG